MNSLILSRQPASSTLHPNSLPPSPVPEKAIGPGGQAAQTAGNAGGNAKTAANPVKQPVRQRGLFVW
ncbi:MAG: hypothetical protein LWX09_00005, partial [Bacteroidia bacterium]|nr:hypothetical protein [Bacteroidia bacterium]